MRLPRVCHVVALALALAGCETGPGGNELGLCSAVCRCAGQLPGQQRACVDECLDSGVEDATKACEVCVFENSSSCSHLVERCFSGGPCNSDPEPEPFPPTRFDGSSERSQEDYR